VNIAVFTDDFYPSTNGGAFEQWEFCKQAAKRSHNVVVFTYRRDGQKLVEQECGVKIFRPVPAGISSIPDYNIASIILRSLFSLGLLVFSIYKLRGKDIDVVYSAPYTTYFVGKVVGAVYGLPYVSFVSNSPSQDAERASKIKLGLEFIIFSRLLSDRVVCRTETIKEVLQYRYDKNAIVVHGFLSEDDIKRAISRDQTSIVDELDVGNDERLLINVGRAIPIKNQISAVQIVSELPQNYRLIIVGDGPSLPELEKAVAEHGLEDQITLTGRVEHEVALQLILASDALLHTSTTESGPIVLFEALSLGSLAFSTPVGRAPNLESDRVYCGTEQELAQIIKDVDIQYRSKHHVQKDALKQYSMSRYTDEVLEELESVVNDGN